MISQQIQPIKFHKERYTEILQLLNQLTLAPIFDKNRFNTIIDSLNENHNIYVYLKDGKIVGMITLLIEQKLIHNGACVAHIEDLVIDKDYQKQGIASELIQYCLTQISSDKCYKIILDCKDELIPFYIKRGFNQTNVQMSKYF
jgi:glucosamine-phosphate N-acetyltransferase